MLPQKWTELLTAYVDGELSQRRRNAVERLLERSAEARELLARLQQDASRLRALPRLRVEPSLVSSILDEIRAQPQTAPVASRRPSRMRPWRVAVGLAAAIMIALGGAGLFRFFWLEQAANNVTIIAEQPAPPPAQEKEPKPAPPKKDLTPPSTNPLIAQVIEGTYSQYAVPVLPERRVQVAFRDLQRPGGALSQVEAELSQSRSVHFDVTVKNTTMALDRLTSAFHDQGISVVVDPDVNSSLKKEANKVEFLVFADNLRSNEITAILQELSKDDNKKNKGVERTPFDKLAVNTLSDAERQQMAARLGVENPAAVEAKPSVDPKNKERKPGRWERSAVVVPANASRMSETMRADLERRPASANHQIFVRIRVEK